MNYECLKKMNRKKLNLINIFIYFVNFYCTFKAILNNPLWLEVSLKSSAIFAQNTDI